MRNWTERPYREAKRKMATELALAIVGGIVALLVVWLCNDRLDLQRMIAAGIFVLVVLNVARACWEVELIYHIRLLTGLLYEVMWGDPSALDVRQEMRQPLQALRRRVLEIFEELGQ